MNVIGFLKEIVGGAAGTAGSLGRIGINTLEKASSATLESWQFYNGVGVRQLRALSLVTGPAALGNFLRESTSLGADVIARMVHDLQKSLTLATEMRIAVEDALSSVTPPEPVATTRTKAVTKSTPV